MGCKTFKKSQNENTMIATKCLNVDQKVNDICVTKIGQRRNRGQDFQENALSCTNLFLSYKE